MNLLWIVGCISVTLLPGIKNHSKLHSGKIEYFLPLVVKKFINHFKSTSENTLLRLM